MGVRRFGRRFRIEIPSSMRHAVCSTERGNSIKQVAAGALAAVLLGGGLVGCSSGSSPTPTAKAYLSAWARGDLQAASAQTTRPQAAREALQSVAQSLHVSRVSTRVGAAGSAQKDGDVPVRFSATLTLRGLGDWTYGGRLLLRKVGGHWRVDWNDTDIHPGLGAGRSLALTRSLPPRASILDGSGQPLFTPTPIVDIGIEPRGFTDPAGSLTVLQAQLHVDPARIRQAVSAAKPDAFVPVITLRRSDYDEVRSAIHDLPGLVFQTGTAELAPTAGFARAVLGRVGEATADVLRAAGPAYAVGDDLGIGGLQQAFQQQLAGRAGGAVTIVDRSGATVSTLKRFAAVPGRPVSTTLDRAVQQAAERALDSVTLPAALVAIRPSDGAILAVANRPADSADNRAFTGRYPPGSTFKVVTTYALLGDGVTPQTPVECPPRVVVDGKAFTNFEGEAPGAIPFAQDFAISCNTAFIGLSKRLHSRDLPDAAGAFGLGGSWQLPLAAYTGSVPTPGDAVEQAAEAIGQGRVLVSPLDMALVAAAVQSGSWHAPELVTSSSSAGGSPSGSASASVAGSAVSTTASPAKPLDAAKVSVLRDLMTRVVTSGTASSAGLPSGTAGKTGTAEFGTDNPPKTHAWFIGYRGDLAFAVLVEGGGVGGSVAAPIAAKFLAAL
jgi:cell division protein FtsI/penicillin-binding protein 2